MTKKEIIKFNELIAKFMGAIQKDYFLYFKEPIGLQPQHDDAGYDSLEPSTKWHCDSLGYHSSWDWLIPVINKCWKLKELNLTGGWHKADRIECRININDIFGNNITEVYKEVIKFIEWYNKQKSK